MIRKLPLRPGHPERVCWGCDKYCAADDMACGNGTDRAQHPVEIFGDDWHGFGIDAPAVEPDVLIPSEGFSRPASPPTGPATLK